MEAYTSSRSSASASASRPSSPSPTAGFLHSSAALWPPSSHSSVRGQLKYLSASSHKGCAYSKPSLKCRSTQRDYGNIPGLSLYDEQDREGSFFERLHRAWRILFPGPSAKHVSNAEIAKQRLRMILISDRCEISDMAKQKIVNNVVGALSSFVEIESEEKVQLNVSADPDLGTVYSVIVPVRRVKAEYQEYGENLRDFQYGDSFGTVRALNLRFERVDDGVE